MFAGRRKEYIIRLPAEEAASKYESGLYFSLSPHAAAQWLILPTTGDRALLRCRCDGPFVEYSEQKLACSRLTPLAEVPLPASAYKLIPAVLTSRSSRRHCRSAPGRRANGWRANQLDGHSPIRQMSGANQLDGHSPVGQAQDNAACTGYKLVAKLGGRYYSLFAGRQMEYGLGSAAENVALRDHQGGLYFHASAFAAAQVEVEARPEGLGAASVPRALLRCYCEGPFVEYPGGKMSCSRLTPLDEVLGWERFRVGGLHGEGAVRARPKSAVRGF